LIFFELLVKLLCVTCEYISIKVKLLLKEGMYESYEGFYQFWRRLTILVAFCFIDPSLWIIAD